ncbi:PALD-like protein [Mya arenaria]|uniref:PALD-like protein n=1 Tax=Mya arenaria TaxID=6604 RepID=A0ABY7DPA4_MYAAR|nr:PALD-like protein [Mya arenaria]
MVPGRCVLAMVPFRCGLVMVPGRCDLVMVPSCCGLVLVPGRCGLVMVPGLCGLVMVPGRCGLVIVPAQEAPLVARNTTLLQHGQANIEARDAPLAAWNTTLLQHGQAHIEAREAPLAAWNTTLLQHGQAHIEARDAPLAAWNTTLLQHGQAPIEAREAPLVARNTPLFTVQVPNVASNKFILKHGTSLYSSMEQAHIVASNKPPLQHDDEVDLIFEGTNVTRTDNHVGPVIIKNCMEEYQHVPDFNEPLVYGSGEYVLVRDHCLPEGESSRQLSLMQAKSWAPVYWSGQPTARELASIIKALENESYPPVLFVNIADDFIPYTIKSRKTLRECVVTGKLVKEADLYEASIRKRVIDMAIRNDDNSFSFYNDIEGMVGEPHVYPVQFEDNLLVAEEVYSRLAFSNPKLRYRRLCFPLHSAPSDLEVDHFISIAQDSPLMSADGSQPAMLFICQTGSGRSNVGAVMGYLLLTHKECDAKQRRPSSAACRLNRMDSEQLQEQGFFCAINRLVAALSEGLNAKHQVDMAIDNCCTTHNLRTEIYNAKKTLRDMQADHATRPADIASQYGRCRDYLARYFFLICFYSYVSDEVSDNYVGLDLLGSQLDVRVANFRKINIKAIPVYGMAQPTSDGLSKVVNHLLNLKVRHTHVVVVNLRNDVMVELDDATYSVRDSGKVDEPIIFPGYSKTDLEDKEEELKRTIRKHKTFQLYNELSDPPLQREVYSAYTILDLAENQRLQTLDMTYQRVPLLCEESPTETDIDCLMSVVCSHCRLEKLQNHTDTAFVFFCRTGKSRSTFAMAVAGLIMCHMKGFPKGSLKGEQERISLPNAQYTKGEFIIVQKLVRMLPNGHQVKREVDFILDEIFNTMTPTMFHMREIIFVTYNKSRKVGRDAELRETLLCQSILYLERYVHLILFNAYLYHDRQAGWKRPFSTWMKEVGARAGVYDVLDNLGFYDFDVTLTAYRKMSVRWRYPVPNVTWQGEFR